MAVSAFAGVSAALNQVVIELEEILEVGKKSLSQVSDDVSTQTAALRNHEVPVSSFSSYDAAAALGRQHDAAQQVYTATIEGVLADLAKFSEILTGTVNSYTAVDEDAQTSLTRLANAVKDTHWSADTANTASREQHANALAYDKVSDVEPAAQPVPTTAPGQTSVG